MCGEKSLLQEIDEVNIAMGLISLGARMQVLESETSLSRRRLLRLYKELRGCPPPKGMLPFSEDWFMSWEQNIHSSMFYNIYLYLKKTEQGRSIALQLEQLAADRLGTPLVEARRDTAPPPITIGEKRRNDHAIVLEATSVIGPRVYWRGERNGRTFKGWMGSSAWRRLDKE